MDASRDREHCGEGSEPANCRSNHGATGPGENGSNDSSESLSKPGYADSHQFSHGSV
jgi:hypothetical protein